MTDEQRKEKKFSVCSKQSANLLVLTKIQLFRFMHQGGQYSNYLICPVALIHLLVVPKESSTKNGFTEFSGFIMYYIIVPLVTQVSLGKLALLMTSFIPTTYL